MFAASVEGRTASPGWTVTEPMRTGTQPRQSTSDDVERGGPQIVRHRLGDALGPFSQLMVGAGSPRQVEQVEAELAGGGFVPGDEDQGQQGNRFVVFEFFHRGQLDAVGAQAGARPVGA
ncbi:hypothetical protein [Streptomyces sp. NPDC058701]|uniref:hypothetical protein n=1 Tax=Streptomyces sp. NPDC058701 TaxID=3346608 RepID=UPI00366A0A6D